MPATCAGPRPEETPLARSRSSTSRAKRSLLWLTAIVVVLVAGLAAAVRFDTATWTPKLALDLAGGTQIILTPQLRGGENADTITDQTIADAITIIRQRIDSSGLTEAEIGSQGGRNIVVALPGDPAEQRQAAALVSQSAQMRFRPVLYVASAAPAATATPSDSATPTDGTTPTDGATSADPATPAATDAATPAASETAAPGASESAQGSRLPGALMAAASPTDAASAAASDAASAAGDAASAAASAAATATDTASAAATDAATPSASPTDPSDLAQVTPELGAAFTALDCSNPVQVGTSLDDDPTKAIATCSQDGSAKYLLGPVEVEGTDISTASAGLATTQTGATTNQWVVDLALNGQGRTEFAATSTRLYGLESPRNQFAIVLDGTVVSAPAIQTPITDGNAQISGSFTQATATTLANQLKFGALPISFTVQSEEQISAVLGSEQLKRGLLAGVIGLVLVMLYSLAQYRALGLVTVASLAIAAGTSFLITDLLSWYQGYRLSLAGVAGFIVSIGITADSFIVFFERVRDEVREGRSLTSAVETGWARARRTIIISDVVNFLAAAVLYFLAIGAVQGFAFILGLTTIIDLIVVMLFTHPVLVLLARRKFFASGHKLSGFDSERLGRAPAYAGRGRVRSPRERDLATAGAPARGSDSAPADDLDDQSSEGEAAREPVTASGRRLTIAERRAAASADDAPSSATPTSEER